MAKDAAQYVDNFSRFAISNIKPDKRTRKKIDVPSVFKYIFEIFAATLNKMQIVRVVEIPSSGVLSEIFAFEIDWESIAVNLMTNSIWAIESNPDRKSSKILVEIAQEEDELVVVYSDSGISLEHGTEESIFLPMNDCLIRNATRVGANT